MSVVDFGSIRIESLGASFENPLRGLAFPQSRVTVLIEVGSGSSEVGGLPLQALLLGMRLLKLAMLTSPIFIATSNDSRG